MLNVWERCLLTWVLRGWIGWAYRIKKLWNADISDFSVYRRVYRIEPPISSISIFSKPVIFLSFFAENSPKILRKFRKFPEHSENPLTKVINNNNAENSKNLPKIPKNLKIRWKFLKKKVFFEALLWYGYRIVLRKNPHIVSIWYRVEKKLITQGWSWSCSRLPTT